MPGEGTVSGRRARHRGLGRPRRLRSHSRLRAIDEREPERTHGRRTSAGPPDGERGPVRVPSAHERRARGRGGAWPAHRVPRRAGEGLRPLCWGVANRGRLERHHRALRARGRPQGRTSPHAVPGDAAQDGGGSARAGARGDDAPCGRRPQVEPAPGSSRARSRATSTAKSQHGPRVPSTGRRAFPEATRACYIFRTP